MKKGMTDTITALESQQFDQYQDTGSVAKENKTDNSTRDRIVSTGLWIILKTPG
ncbi:MAG: hypothetical protein U5R30_20085 [Deltaproteobacteria bacterium]|nr:hypothetical protein [Deltaproteobacteria bacterium]